MGTSLTKRLLAALLMLGMGAGFLLLAPSRLGGSATWVSTSGVSMAPAIRTGDLVIARPQDDYGVGDVVAFRSADLNGAVVLHRIVAEEPDGFVTQGDNNDWLDPDRPQAADILGELWLHIPQGGRVLTSLANPLVVGGLLALALSAGGLLTHRSRRRRTYRGRRAAGPTVIGPRQPLQVGQVRDAAVAAGILALALGGYSFSQPTTSTARGTVPVTHTGHLGYATTVTTDGVYAGDRLVTGDPVLLRVAPAIDTTLDYRLGFDAGQVTGTVRSLARVTAGNGWTREVPLGTQAAITGLRVERTVPVDFTALIRTARLAETRAGTTFGGLTVEVVHRVEATGTVDGRQSTTTTSPSLRFALGGDQAVLQAKEGTPGDGRPVATTDRSSVSVSEAVPATVTVLRWDVPVSVLRLLSAGLGVLALAALLLAARPGGAIAPERLLARRLVRASNVDLGDRPVIDVDDATALARLADLHDAVVLHVPRAPHDLYVVVADQAVYRLAVSSSMSVAQRQRTPAGLS